jgi:phosphopantothenoylcysteine decarboxylase / phosphopantothenate---cysteine ligase
VQQGTEKRSLLFCISGSIAAISVVEVLRLLVERGIFDRIHIALTGGALKFVREEPFAVISGHRCVTDIFQDAREGDPVHVRLAKECEIALIAPASANFMAKLANGIADDAATNILNVFSGPKILVPAAHPSTSRLPSFRRNLRLLRDDGFYFCGPVDGYSISENRRGADIGAIPRPEVIAAYVEYVAAYGGSPDVTFKYSWET